MQAVEREIAEEVGIAFTATDMLCLVNQIDREAGVHWVSPVYLVEDFAGEPVNREPEKHADMAWFALDALPEPLTEPTRQALAALARR